MNEQSLKCENRIHVIAVCCGQGFPTGMALTYRIKMVGLALLNAGARFSVFHVGGSPFGNSLSAGVWNGIAYRYFPGDPRREPRRWMRLWKNFCGLAGVAAEIHRLRRRGEQIVVYSDFYGGENILLAATGAPVIAEISEWYPGRTDRTWWLRFIAAAGAVPISRALEERLQIRMRKWRRNFPQLRIPVLMDMQADSKLQAGPQFEPPYLLWMGDPYGEIRAHLDFLIDVLARVREKHPDCKLVLLGNFSENLKNELESQAERVVGTRSAVVVHGFVPKEQLAIPIAEATALLAPLPTGVRWECCFPTKLGEYLASGRPVVSSRIGEVAEYLRDGQTAMLAPPGDVGGWSERIVRLLADPEMACRIGEAGRAMALRELDYRAHSKRLLDFVTECKNRPSLFSFGRTTT